MLAKISLVQSFRTISLNSQLRLEHLLVLINKKNVNLYETRRFLLNKYPSLNLQWRNFTNEELISASEEASSFIIENRSKWNKEYQIYQSNLLKYHQFCEKMRKRFDLDRHLSKQVFLIELKKQYEKSKIMLKNRENATQKIAQGEHEELRSFIRLMQSIVQQEEEEKKYIHPNDKEDNETISEFLRQFNSEIEEKTRDELEDVRKQLLRVIDEYNFVMAEAVSNCEQIFLYYCRESLQNEVVSNTYEKVSQLLDLRFFIKYFEDLGSQEQINHKFEVGELSKLFKQHADRGKYLNFSQFLKIHKELFEIIQQNTSKDKMNSSDPKQLAKLEEKYRLNLEKAQKFKNLLTSKQVTSKINALSKADPIIKLTKSQSTSLPKILHHQRSRSQKSNSLSSRKSYIQQIRRQISNEQISLANQIIQRKSSLQLLIPKQEHLVQFRLPKILKIPNQQIESQGIYQSLKKFANFDYLSQQKKIKNIIGLSIGDDEEYMNAYFKNQSHVKQYKQLDKSRIREQNRKRVMENLQKKQSLCKKHDPSQIEPYMRF